MSLREDHDYQHLSDYQFEEEIDDLPKRKKIKKMLEDKLERKRFKNEFKDDFDELSGEFDWDEIDK